MNPAAAGPDKAQVQRLIVYGYTLHRSRHFVLRVDKPAQAREFLAAVAAGGWITDASLDRDGEETLAKKGGCAVNIGFTYQGLKALELHNAYLRVFQEKAPAFADGAYLRAAQRLADTGRSAAPWWEKRFQPDNAHVLLSLHADTKDALKNCSAELKRLAKDDCLEGWHVPFDGKHLTKTRNWRTVHFGLRDGIADPDIKGFHKPKRWQDGSRERVRHAPGEFLLGYLNDDKYNPWLLVNPSTRPNPWLLPLNKAPELAEFFRNGSFAAFRKIEQHEKAFREFEAKWAAKLAVSEEYVRAKLCGRWDNGYVAKPGETEAPSVAPPGDPAELDEFDYAGDVRGEGCPFGAHIRRLNPRDPKARQVVPAGTRTLIRRGMPYGPPYDEYEQGEQPERGLLGLFFCASLEDQFEHLLVEWANANPMGPPIRGKAKDPLVGNHEDPRAAFDIPMAGEKRRQFEGFQPFVTTRGTLYAFFPSLVALSRIASCGPPPPPPPFPPA